MRDQELEGLLTLSRWDQLPLAEQAAVAGAVATRLPAPFRLAGLEDHELDQQRHRVACFTWNEARFALLPGGPATLGYESGSFRPTAAQQHSWEETCREYPEMLLQSPTLERYLENRLTPLRQVTVRPFLLETVATDLAPRVFDPVRRGYRMTFASYPQTQERLAQAGFRLPTSDEWEYACAAGARTLWRWGDDCPLIDMPLRRRQQPVEWDLHLRPNAFGLLIGDDPFNLEFTAEPGVFRGGDGGTALHVCPGRFIEWVTLASAYWYPFRVPKPEVSTAFLRRAYSLFNESQQGRGWVTDEVL